MWGCVVYVCMWCLWQILLKFPGIHIESAWLSLLKLLVVLNPFCLLSVLWLDCWISKYINIKQTQRDYYPLTCIQSWIKVHSISHMPHTQTTHAHNYTYTTQTPHTHIHITHISHTQTTHAHNHTYTTQTPYTYHTQILYTHWYTHAPHTTTHISHTCRHTHHKLHTRTHTEAFAKRAWYTV